ncbi:MAG: mechanosensitive ion channel [Cyclobacteriaceae bacterium]|nr:mechanosensitive ion channel [Cyclobacteriaceae bacterium]
MDFIDKYAGIVVDMAVQYAPKILLALVVLIVGLRIVKILMNLMRNALNTRNVEETLSRFLSNLIGWLLKVVVFISVFSILGVETTSFVALLGAAGLAVGLALQGSLANFAGGVLILLFKPFKVGDKIQSMGRTGNVKEIQIINTILTTADNKTVILPNGAVMNGDIINYSVEGMIRVDLTVGISYDSDIRKAKELLMQIMQEHPKVLKDPAPFVGVEALADSSVNLAVRPHCNPDDYWDVYFEVLENCKITLDAAGISIPFPQLDVHMDK